MFPTRKVEVCRRKNKANGMIPDCRNFPRAASARPPVIPRKLREPKARSCVIPLITRRREFFVSPCR